MGKLCFNDEAPGLSDGNRSSAEDSDDYYSSEEEEEEEEQEEETSNNNSGPVAMDNYRYRNVPQHNEYIVKNAENIRLEYLIQIRY